MPLVARRCAFQLLLLLFNVLQERAGGALATVNVAFSTFDAFNEE